MANLFNQTPGLTSLGSICNFYSVFAHSLFDVQPSGWWLAGQWIMLPFMMHWSVAISCCHMGWSS